MTFADAAIDHVEALNAHIAGAPASIVEQHLLEPTVRPAAAHELTRAGLYVFAFSTSTTPTSTRSHSCRSSMDHVRIGDCVSSGTARSVPPARS
jgi:hypothetical protein